MITPTPGRVVWYWPTAQERAVIATLPGQPLPATVAAVWSDTCVNLGILDANGNLFSRTSVPLLQDDAPRPDGGFCEWMPYQKGQAAKAEQLEKLAAGAVSAPASIDPRPDHCPDRLREQGKPYPRSCATCGIFKCQHAPTTPNNPA